MAIPWFCSAEAFPEGGTIRAQLQVVGRGVRQKVSGRSPAVFGCYVLLLVTPVAHAVASEGEGNARAGEQIQSPDFLFGRPAVSIGVRGQWHLAPPDSDIFDFTTELLTLEKSDFRAPGIGVDLGIPIISRLDGIFGFEFTGASAFSEYRDFVEDNDLPIEQMTTLTQINLSGSVELAVLGRGREIGQYAWIPRAVIPYVGGGGGFLWYRFEQQGDFVDFFDLAIFVDRLTSSGWTPSAHVFGGIDIKLTRRLYVSTELRYLWAKAAMEQDFIGFEDIDLTGLRVTGGIQILF